jgi:3D-(3,5/4)-trihydroxycyclohexane-1,2-dione acylhydrolase (decyclizing)
MPQDVEAEAYDYPDYFLQKRVWYMDRRPAGRRELEAAAAMIETAKKPLMIIGGGVTYSEAWETAQFFAEKFHIPVTETQSGKGQIRWDHP